MNLNQYRDDLIYHKYYGRNYHGMRPKDCRPSKVENHVDSFVKSRRSILFGANAIDIPEVKLPSAVSLTESVIISDVVSWFNNVKKQLNSMIDDVYSNNVEVSSLLKDVLSEFEIHFPREDESSEGVREKMEDLYRTLKDYIDNTEGSLTQYLTQLSDTVKAVSVDDIEETSVEEEEMPATDDMSSKTPSSSLENPEEGEESDLDFEKELASL